MIASFNKMLTLDTRQFTENMRTVLALRKTDCVKVLNRAGRNVAFRAQKLTPKATTARIRRDLNKTVKRRGAKGQTKLLYLLAMWARANGLTGKLTQAQIVDIVTKFAARRLRSRNYISAGWFKVAADFGATVRRYSRKGLAGKSRGQKATLNSLVAVLENAARGADKVGRSALQQSVNEVGKEMSDYAREEFAKSDAKLRK